MLLWQCLARRLWLARPTRAFCKKNKNKTKQKQKRGFTADVSLQGWEYEAPTRRSLIKVKHFVMLLKDSILDLLRQKQRAKGSANDTSNISSTETALTIKLKGLMVYQQLLTHNFIFKPRETCGSWYKWCFMHIMNNNVDMPPTHTHTHTPAPTGILLGERLQRDLK